MDLICPTISNRETGYVHGSVSNRERAPVLYDAEQHTQVQAVTRSDTFYQHCLSFTLSVTSITLYISSSHTLMEEGKI